MLFADTRDELTNPAPVVDWLLPGFIPRGSLIALSGMPGVGKSYLSYSLGLALASGIPFLGMQPSQPYRVLYFDEENSRHDRVGYLQRVWRGLGCPNLDTLCPHFFNVSCGLGVKDWETEMAVYVREAKPDLIIVDTATPAFAIQDENDNAEASQVIVRLREQMRAHSSACVVLKHAKRLDRSEDGSSYTMRGAKAWISQVDSVIYHTRGEGRPAKGLHMTHLRPSKTRAFGLDHELLISPAHCGSEDAPGIRLSLV